MLNDFICSNINFDDFIGFQMILKFLFLNKLILRYLSFVVLYEDLLQSRI